MHVECFTVGSFSVNTYLLTDEATGLSAIVDTGETNELVRHLKARTPAPNIQMILLTHTHLDHAGALSFLQDEWDVPTYMPAADRPFVRDPTHAGFHVRYATSRPTYRPDRP